MVSCLTIQHQFSWSDGMLTALFPKAPTKVVTRTWSYKQSMASSVKLRARVVDITDRTRSKLLVRNTWRPRQFRSNFIFHIFNWLTKRSDLVIPVTNPQFWSTTTRFTQIKAYFQWAHSLQKPSSCTFVFSTVSSTSTLCTNSPCSVHRQLKFLGQ